MIINKITLRNFKVYENETTLDLRPCGSKNIILIGGENGSGKSTLFEAIKLCIYGSASYGYVGNNYRYIAKIRNMINHYAYLKDTVKAEVSLEIVLEHKDSPWVCGLSRSWEVNDTDFLETFQVSRDGALLTEEELSYFHQYITTVLPPAMFDFFFFDGEELSSFFQGNAAGEKIKNSLLQLMNYDTFRILKNHLITYQNQQNKNSREYANLDRAFEEAQTRIKDLSQRKAALIDECSRLEDEIQNIRIQEGKIQADFLNKGGLLESERNSLTSSLNSLESRRSALSAELKDFCNDSLPFLLVRDKLEEISRQIEKEETLASYNAAKKALSPDLLGATLNKHMDRPLSGETIHEIIRELLGHLYDSAAVENIKEIFQLNNEQRGAVNRRFEPFLADSGALADFPKEQYREINELSQKIKRIREKLAEAATTDFAKSYEESREKLSQTREEKGSLLLKAQASLETVENDLAVHSAAYNKLKAQKYNYLLRESSTSLSLHLSDMLEELISLLTDKKLGEIEACFMDIFNRILRKENFIDSIKFDKDFVPTLYTGKSYSTAEIKNIIKNIGFDSIEVKYGIQFLSALYEHYSTSNRDDFLAALALETTTEDNIVLPSKISIESLSNGEKQIYVLCLVWSILKVTGVDIPFIIDTPYSRIDSSHRAGLTTQYLPNVSRQVIILSTNEEIDAGLRQQLEPYIANEYLLCYDTDARKTTVENHYFEV